MKIQLVSWIFSLTFILNDSLYSQSINELDSLLKLIDDRKIDTTQLNINRAIGDYYFNINTQKAILYFESAKKISENLNRTDDLASNLYSIGSSYLNLGKFDSALEYYLNACRIYEQKGYKRRLTKAFIDIAYLYSESNNFPKGRLYFDKAKILINDLQDTVELRYYYSELGNFYFKQEQIDSAILCIEESKNLSKILGEPDLIIGANVNIGLLYKKKGNYDLALQYMNGALTAYKKNTNNPSELGVVYNNLGSIYAAQKKYNQAERAFFKSLDYVNSIDAKFVVLENYQNLMDLYEQMKDYKSQSIYLKKYYQLKDSIYAIDKLNELNQLESEYQLEKKNSEILKKDKAFIKSNSQRNIFILIAFSILLALALLFLFYKKLQSKNHIVERQKEELLTLNHVKDRLFSIISHDLRNPLVTLKSYLLLSDSESISADKKLLFKNQTISAVVQTGDLLDNLLTWANLQIKNTSANIVPVSIQECVGDVVSVVDYQAKQKNIQIIQKIEPLMIPANMDILSIALRNLITNAIKFSFKNSEIIIKTIQSDDYTLLVVEDHGVGISNEKLELIQMNQNESTPGTNGERGSGLGLYLVKEMLKKINAQLQVESILEKGSKFIIKIPR